MARALDKYDVKATELKTLETIMNDFRRVTDYLQEMAVKAALARQKEITPLLLNLLDEAITGQQSTEDSISHLYAMFLLAQFREPAAFPRMIQLASLPDNEPEILLGDCITEHLHRMLGSVYDGDLSAIKNLIENPRRCEWSRNAGIKSLLVLVKTGTLERDTVIQYFKMLFSHPALVDDPIVMTQLVLASCDLYPVELLDEIKAAFKRNIIDTRCVDREFVDAVLTMDKASALKQYLDEHYELINDTVFEMQKVMPAQAQATYH